MSYESDTIQNYRVECARYGVPMHIRTGLCDFLVRGKPGGAFVTAMVSNDFVAAACLADNESAKSLTNCARFLANIAPLESWGSKERVDAWIAAGGQLGRSSARRGLHIAS